MSVEHGIRLALLISGYIREKEDKLELYMNIPDGIAKIMHKLYPLLFFKFGDFKKGIFEVNQDRTVLKGITDCNGYLIYADISQYSNTGLDKGVHVWSIKSLGIDSGCCYISIGVTTEKNDLLINDWDHDGLAMSDWPVAGYHSHYAGADDMGDKVGWKRDEVVTMKLDCDQSRVTYYRDKEEIKSDKIEPNQSYYPAVLCCGHIEQTHLQIIENFVYFTK